ncbi:MAG: hypothetical protein IJC54_06675, partial [Clostridia bacterium]|nr:hypothetical protein [Clostridia bacterium]
MKTKTKRPRRHIRGSWHVLSRAVLSAAALVILVPLAVTFLYSFFSPAEIKAFLDTRGSYDKEVFMDVLLSPKVASLS